MKNGTRKLERPAKEIIYKYENGATLLVPIDTQKVGNTDKSSSVTIFPISKTLNGAPSN